MQTNNKQEEDWLDDRLAVVVCRPGDKGWEIDALSSSSQLASSDIWTQLVLSDDLCIGVMFGVCYLNRCVL